jgi:hypothetical protein
MVITLYAITIINVLVAGGFAIAGLVRPALVAPGQQTEASPRLRALHLRPHHPGGARHHRSNTLGPGSRRAVAQCLAGLIQLFDGYVGTQLKNPRTTWGPIAIAALQLAALAWVVFGAS